MYYYMLRSLGPKRHIYLKKKELSYSKYIVESELEGTQIATG